MPTFTVSTTKDITIKGALRSKLIKELRLFAELYTQKKAIDQAMDKHKAVIAELREETGETSIKLEGFSSTLVAPIRSKFDAKRFVSLGGDLAIYNQAVVNVPSRSYEKISIPGASDTED